MIGQGVQPILGLGSIVILFKMQASAMITNEKIQMEKSSKGISAAADLQHAH